MAGDVARLPPQPTPININSPFYLGSADLLGDFINPTHLKLDNYDDWTTNIKMALEEEENSNFLMVQLLRPFLPTHIMIGSHLMQCSFLGSLILLLLRTLR